MAPRFALMVGPWACGNWRTLCDHGRGVNALWGAINTREARRS